MNKARIVFAGTPDFASTSLAALFEAGVIPLAALTQPDRPAGRGKKVMASAVKLFAQDASIPVWQPGTLKDADIIADLAALEPDLVIVAAYGLLLPQAFLDIPRHGCLNVHASLLPRWRGAAPIQAAILCGDSETGISLMQMDAGLDTGPVFARATMGIGADETAKDLHDRLASLGGELLVKHLREILDGTLVAQEQAAAGATYAPKIRKADAKMDWTQSSTELHRHVRAYNPVPGASFEFQGEVIKCWQANISDAHGELPGKILTTQDKSIVVACSNGSLSLTELQRPGRRRVTAPEFAAQFDLNGAIFQ